MRAALAALPALLLGMWQARAAALARGLGRLLRAAALFVLGRLLVLAVVYAWWAAVVGPLGHSGLPTVFSWVLAIGALCGAALLLVLAVIGYQLRALLLARARRWRRLRRAHRLLAPLEAAGLAELFHYWTVVEEARRGTLAVVRDETGALYRPNPDRVSWALLLVENATREPDGSRTPHLLLVPIECTTPRAAVAWTFGLSAEEYAPALES